jgi:5-methylthioadenosine/S-adenosylhomocysteine deaminase
MTATRQVIRNGQVLDPERRTVEAADILIQGDAILELGPPGLDAPEDAAVIDAADRLLMPGLVNAHTWSWQPVERLWR